MNLDRVMDEMREDAERDLQAVTEPAEPMDVKAQIRAKVEEIKADALALLKAKPDTRLREIEEYLVRRFSKVSESGRKRNPRRIAIKLFLQDKSFREHAACPSCLDEGKEGVLMPRKSAWGIFGGCSNYPKCDFSVDDEHFTISMETLSDFKDPRLAAIKRAARAEG